MTSHVDDKPITHAPGRRAVTRGMAWTVPVVALAVAAPASANHSGGCLFGTLDWDTVKSGCQTGKVLVAGGGTGVTVTVTTSGDTAHADNGTVTSTTTGGRSKVMRFYDENNVTDTVQTVTIMFSKPVQNVSFSLLDVDSKNSGGISGGTREYEDVVTILSPASWSGTVHSNVKGDGTPGNPYRAVGTDSPAAGSSSRSNVDLAFVGPLTQIMFSYAQDGKVHGDPFIGISDICFQFCS